MKKLLIPIIIIAAACASPKEKTQSISELADAYLERMAARYPEERYYFDVPFDDHNRFSDNGLEALAAWQAFEDSLYTELQGFDASGFAQADQITYWLLKEELERSQALRACKRELWDVDHKWNFYNNWLSVVDFQPVGSDSLRKQALERWNIFPGYVDVEIDKLEHGLAEGYSMPKEIVRLVIDQVDVLSGYRIEESPFMGPAERDSSAAFKTAWQELVLERIHPALAKYGDYLKNDYLPQARDEASVLALPTGEACYRAYIRSNTTTNRTGKDIFEQGLQIVQANSATVQDLGQRLYGTSDFTEIIAGIKSDSTLYFKTADEVLAHANAMVDSARLKCADWFDLFPSSDMTVKPYLPHESGIGSYEMATDKNPAYFRISLRNPERQTYHNNEKLAFHEGFPGHHLQLGIEGDIEGLHPIREIMGFTSYAEGWARYAEQLSEEMGLYQHQASLIHRRSWPARGMVIDPALHLNLWPRDSIIDFMMASGMSHGSATRLYQRSIVSPAQLTSYDVGGEEFKSLRKQAETELQDDFDIKEFHKVVLENGSIPLSALRFQVEQWIARKQSGN
ncbi:DUF885 domain-containing protein [Flagellimonas sp. DF-77]|uniref:DUF885 domain-containing protein n=1 Tax=Flagellimonas algarum TaxID=3230298 RepID=UPI003399094A